MSRIMLLYDTPSLLVVSMYEQLNAFGHSVVKCELKLKDLSLIRDEQDAILIFADEDLSDNMDALVYVKDKSIDFNAPIFAIGDDREINLLQQIIPSSMVARIFTRPVNVRNVITTIQDYLSDEMRVSKKKILVVDDSGAMLRNVKGWLEGRYNVVLANSGAMAIKYLALEQPDLVLLDYEMPVVDGKQVLEMMRSESDFVDIPVFFLTSKSDRQSVMDVMGLKPQGYLLKTMPPSEIIDTIDEFFSKQRIKEAGY